MGVRNLLHVSSPTVRDESFRRVWTSPTVCSLGGARRCTEERIRENLLSIYPPGLQRETKERSKEIGCQMLTSSTTCTWTLIEYKLTRSKTREIGDSIFKLHINFLIYEEYLLVFQETFLESLCAFISFPNNLKNAKDSDFVSVSNH